MEKCKHKIESIMLILELASMREKSFPHRIYKLLPKTWRLGSIEHPLSSFIGFVLLYVKHFLDIGAAFRSQSCSHGWFWFFFFWSVWENFGELALSLSVSQEVSSTIRVHSEVNGLMDWCWSACKNFRILYTERKGEFDGWGLFLNKIFDRQRYAQLLN